MNDYKLIIFDVDGTLSEYKTGQILPNVRETLAALPTGIKFALASNQGGVGLNYWMRTDNFGNPDNYPTEWDVRAQIEKLLKELNLEANTYLSFAYQSRQSGKWNPMPLASETDLEFWRHDWRKPEAGMLLRAMSDFEVSPDDTLMIGDWSEDEEAALKAGCAFQHADDFFGCKPIAENPK